MLLLQNSAAYFKSVRPRLSKRVSCGFKLTTDRGEIRNEGIFTGNFIPKNQITFTKFYRVAVEDFEIFRFAAFENVKVSDIAIRDYRIYICSVEPYFDDQILFVRFTFHRNFVREDYTICATSDQRHAT